MTKASPTTRTGTLVLYGADGMLERSYSLGTKPLAATLGGSDLIILEERSTTSTPTPVHAGTPGR
jgi:hypothetical protein